jgi:RimJ/RimL family protein N-acetyltransferase
VAAARVTPICRSRARAARCPAAVMDAQDRTTPTRSWSGWTFAPSSITSVTHFTQFASHRNNTWGVIERLRDGAAVLIRPIRADDKRMLSDGLRRLSDDSAQRRFLTPKRSFSRAELRYLTEVDGRDHVALVAEYPAEPVRRLIAVARFVRLADDPEAAEVAITVADDWQRRGLGSRLSELLAEEARRLNIRRFTATMAADNVAAHRLMGRLTDQLEQHYVGSGVDELVLDIAA